MERYVDSKIIERVTAAMLENPGGYLKPVYLALEEKVSYEEIKLVFASLRGGKKR